MLHLTSPIIWN